MLSTRDGIARAIETRSPVDIDRHLIHAYAHGDQGIAPSRSKHIEVLFMAPSIDARHDLGPDNYTDEEIADLAGNTIREIVRGKLPPGTSFLI